MKNTAYFEARHHGVDPLYELIGFPLVLDTFHLAISRTHPDQIARPPASAIGLVHLSDAITTGKELELCDADRVLPGEGELPLEDLLDGIRRTGYSGPVSVEVFHPKYRERDPTEVAGDAFRAVRTILDATGWTV